MMSNNDKIKLDDSVLEDVDSNIDKNELKNKNKVSKIDQEVSMDDLFDFKPIGVVGDEDSYMKSVTEIKTPKTQQTKKQKLESILDSNDDTISFIDESIQNKCKGRFQNPRSACKPQHYDPHHGVFVFRRLPHRLFPSR